MATSLKFLMNHWNLEIKPNFPIAHSNLGNILRDLGKLPEAEVLLRKAIELNPNFAEAHLNLGNTMKDLGKYYDAINSYKKAIKLNLELYYIITILTYNLIDIIYAKGSF